MIATVLWWAVTCYVWVLLARVLISWVPHFSPGWTPRGLGLVLVEGVYTITDPPLKLIQRVVPPLRVGNVALDMSVLVLFVALQFVQVAIAFLA